MASNESTHIDDSQVQMMQHLSTDHFHEKERSIHFVTPSRDNSGAPYLSMVDIHYTLECCGEIVIFRDEHEELPVDIREGHNGLPPWIPFFPGQILFFRHATQEDDAVNCLGVPSNDSQLHGDPLRPGSPLTVRSSSGSPRASPSRGSPYGVGPSRRKSPCGPIRSSPTCSHPRAFKSPSPPRDDLFHARPARTGCNATLSGGAVAQSRRPQQHQQPLHQEGGTHPCGTLVSSAASAIPDPTTIQAGPLYSSLKSLVQYVQNIEDGGGSRIADIGRMLLKVEGENRLLLLENRVLLRENHDLRLGVQNGSCVHCEHCQASRSQVRASSSYAPAPAPGPDPTYHHSPPQQGEASLQLEMLYPRLQEHYSHQYGQKESYSSQNAYGESHSPQRDHDGYCSSHYGQQGSSYSYHDHRRQGGTYSPQQDQDTGSLCALPQNGGSPSAYPADSSSDRQGDANVAQAGIGLPEGSRHPNLSNSPTLSHATHIESTVGAIADAAVAFEAPSPQFNAAGPSSPVVDGQGGVGAGRLHVNNDALPTEHDAREGQVRADQDNVVNQGFFGTKDDVHEPVSTRDDRIHDWVQQVEVVNSSSRDSASPEADGMTGGEDE